MGVITWVLSNWKYVLLGILTGIIYWQKTTIDSLEKGNLDYTKTIAVQKSKLESITAGVDLANSRVDALIKSGDELVALIEQADIRATKIRDQSTKTIQEILKQKVPADCAGAFDWTYDKSKETLKDWK